MTIHLADTTDHYTTSQGYGRTSQHVAYGELVRIEVYVDSYEKQSYARAKIMTSDAGWQPLVEAPTSGWYSSAPSYVNKDTGTADQFTYRLRENLAIRAERVIKAWKGAGA
jgi:hypothetical protein